MLSIRLAALIVLITFTSDLILILPLDASVASAITSPSKSALILTLPIETIIPPLNPLEAVYVYPPLAMTIAYSLLPYFLILPPRLDTPSPAVACHAVTISGRLTTLSPTLLP